MNKKKNFWESKIFQLFIWLIPILFLFDDIMGTNGYQFTIFGKGIRIVLFALSFALLMGYSILVMVLENISLFSRKNRSLFQYIKPIDILVTIFLVGNFIWATVIPLLVRGDTVFALKDFSTILVLMLYFPAAFLIRTGRLKVSILETLAYGFSFILAVWHCVMFVGETVFPGFYPAYYDFIQWLSGGTAVITDVIYGYGLVRVIQTTSLFLLPGIFFAIRSVVRGKFVHLVSVFVFLFAICTTFTKSIWFGFAAGLAVSLFGVFLFCKDKKVRIRCIVVFLFIAVSIVLLNFAVFENKIYTRAMHSVQKPSHSSTSTEFPSTDDITVDTDTDSDVIFDDFVKDSQGTQEANALRDLQTKALLNKWNQSKLLGFGYGGYAEDCIRQGDYPFMYETLLPALLMKLGVVGLLLWIIFILGTTVCACRVFWERERSSLFLWLGIALSFGMAVQTNPFLFTFPGFSVLLLLLLAFQEKRVERGEDK